MTETLDSTHSFLSIRELILARCRIHVCSVRRLLVLASSLLNVRFALVDVKSQSLGQMVEMSTKEAKANLTSRVSQHPTVPTHYRQGPPGLISPPLP